MDDLCIDSLVKDSLNAGTRIEAVDSPEGVMFYCAKYLGKECPVSEEWDHVGRYWGVEGRKFMPWSAVEEIAVSRRTAILHEATGAEVPAFKGRGCGDYAGEFYIVYIKHGGMAARLRVVLRGSRWSGRRAVLKNYE